MLIHLEKDLDSDMLGFDTNNLGDDNDVMIEADPPWTDTRSIFQVRFVICLFHEKRLNSVRLIAQS